jgi:pimeloyl-ACP methyl ester carboxylesterase
MNNDVLAVQVSDIQIAYETFGQTGNPPVLLIMGFASQMLSWPDEFCLALAERGHNVIRFDNRDVGLSTHLEAAPEPDIIAALEGDFSSASYQLTDMATDAVGLLDAIGVDSAHVVGVSMGAMIAQVLAITHPERVRSLVSMMSTTGDPAVGQPSPAAMGALLAPAAASREKAIERTLAAYRVLGSPGFPLDEERLREIAARSYDRSFDPGGTARQLVAVLASGDRTAALRSVRVPTLVIHGDADPLINVSGGQATAAAIPGAELVVIEGMGHDLSPGLLLRFVDRISAFVARAGASATQGRQ